MNAFGKIPFVVPDGEVVNNVCGNGERVVYLTQREWQQWCAARPDYPAFQTCHRDSLCQKFCDVTEAIANVSVGNTTITQQDDYKRTGCIFLSGPYCDQDVFTKCPGGGVWAWDITFENFVEITDMSNNRIGKNPAAGEMTKPVRPFVCEICAPVGGGNVTVDNAAVLAALAGATFDGSGLPADDPATVYLHEIDATLTPLGDEAVKPDGTTFVTTTCQAVGTDTETGKSKDIEPGGNYALAVPRGNDVPSFSLEITEGSNMVICGSVSICMNKNGGATPKV